MLPESSGIYFVTDNAHRVYYIGKATSLRNRLSRHERMPDFCAVASFVSYYLCDIEDIDGMESQAIGLFNPPLNSNLLQSSPLVDVGLSETETLKRYIYLQRQKKLIDKEMSCYKPNLVTIIEKNDGHISGKGYSGHIRKVPVWKYSPKVQDLEKELKQLKQTEREKGVATFETINISPVIRISQNGIDEAFALMASPPQYQLAENII